MKRVATLAAIILLLPGIAGATQAPHGITVTGTGSSRTPATTVRISVQLGSADRSNGLDKQKLQPIVDALIKAGANPSRIRLPLTFNAGVGANIASINVTFPRPTAKTVQNGVASAAAALATVKDAVVLYNLQVFVIAQNCQHTLAIARQQAIASARAKAEAIAKDLNVQIGPAISAESHEMTSADGSCFAQYFISAQGDQSGLQTPQDYVTVPATANITITYAIK
ncbi:MAG: SIMPL domain-containing protein [Candidatus Aquilonibacter sp.]